MSFDDSMDKPPFDINVFNAEAEARVQEFDATVKRLAILAMPEASNEYERIRGAGFWLPDDTRVEAQRIVNQLDKTDITSRLKITPKPKEFHGDDGNLRRVTISRLLEYIPKWHEAMSDEAMLQLQERLDADPTVPDPPAGLEEKLRELHRLRFDSETEDIMHSEYQPPEFIHAKNYVLVERQSPNKRFFSEEHIHSTTPQWQQDSHMAARFRAGDTLLPVSYSIAEHQALMSLLSELKPSRGRAQPLDTSF